jgi:small subunit ribosomal protein S17
MTQDKKTTARIFRGLVVSDKMAKTIVVRVDRTVLHAKYQKRYITSRRYKVHDESKIAKIGDLVEFVECRPLSRDKRWRLVKVVKTAI